MSSSEVYESLMQEVILLERTAMIQRLAHFDGDLRLDFSPSYLERCDNDRLRHLLMAALWRCRMKSHA